MVTMTTFFPIGPSKAEVTCKDNHDGTCTVDYLPTKEGDYDISVKFADKNIPGEGLQSISLYQCVCVIGDTIPT